MRTFREKLLTRIDEVVKKAGLECIDDGEDEQKRLSVFVQNPRSFETVFAFRLWRDNTGGTKGSYIIFFSTPKNLAEGKFDDVQREALRGKRFEFYPHNDDKIEKFLAYLDDLAIKKVGVHQALAGAAGTSDQEGEAAHES